MHRAMMIVGQVGICFNGVFDVAVGGCSCSQTQAMVKPHRMQSINAANVWWLEAMWTVWRCELCDSMVPLWIC